MWWESAYDSEKIIYKDLGKRSWVWLFLVSTIGEKIIYKDLGERSWVWLFLVSTIGDAFML
jgi:hypothetical protein